MRQLAITILYQKQHHGKDVFKNVSTRWGGNVSTRWGGNVSTRWGGNVSTRWGGKASTHNGVNTPHQSYGAKI